ncbi:Uncharacterised protein [Citrobacter koseri]|nr:Uncharacterised protein [Citrobacter koseri]
MYGEEKSDSLIVAAKQANNPKGAESVERRSGAKGNAEQPHMRRTQSRESMSQRLSRVREAAKQRKKERFTALFHLLTVEALEAAFLSLSRKAAAGVDGIRWMDYAGNMKNNRHCCKVSDEAAFCLIQRPYISKTLLTRRISPRGSP